jgi:hypothetical protein
MRVEATPAELASVQRRLESGRTELMRHVSAITSQAGFVNKDEQALASMMLLLGAAQRYALTLPPGGYQIFKAIALDMANSEANAVVRRGMIEGPEIESAFEDVAPSIIRPGRV